MGVKDHPLFDPPTDNKARDIHFVIVQRMQGGTWITSPAPHTHDDFPSLQALQAIYGGGKYRLMARDALNARIVARKDWDLPGPPLPFPGEAPAAPPGIPMAPAAAGGDMSERLLMFMMQSQQQAAQQGEARMMQFMQMMSAQQAQQSQVFAGIVTALVQQKPPDSSQAMLSALQMGINLGGIAREESGGGEGGDLLEQIAAPLVQGAMQAALEKPDAPPTKTEGGKTPEGEGSSTGGNQ